MSSDREKERLDWHSGFDGGLNLSFMKYKKISILRENIPCQKNL